MHAHPSLRMNPVPVPILFFVLMPGFTPSYCVFGYFSRVLKDEGSGKVKVSKHNLFFAAGDILRCETFDPFTHVYMFDIGRTCPPALHSRVRRASVFRSPAMFSCIPQDLCNALNNTSPKVSDAEGRKGLAYELRVPARLGVLAGLETCLFR